MSDLPKGNDPGEPQLDEEIEEGPEPEGEEPELDEGDGEPEGEVGEESEPGPQPVAARGAGRARGQPYGEQIRTLQRQIETQKQDFERQLQAALQANSVPSPAQLQAEAEMERQRFELMSPYEQYQYTQQKIEAGVQRQTQQIAHTLWNQNDQRDYEALLERTPAYRRYDDKVAELQRQAPGVSRRILLATAIGMRALEQGGTARTRAATAAAATVARNGAGPSQSRGDVTPARGRRSDDLEERLRGQSI